MSPARPAPCRVCGGRDAAPYAAKDGYRFVRCGGCGFVYLDPMPSPRTLAALYGGDAGEISAERYPKAASRMRRARIKALRFARYFRGGKALDIGCGGGFVVEAMRRRGAWAAGLDIDARAIAYARGHFPDCAFFCEDFATFAARGLVFDFVYCSEVIEHLPDLDGFMRLLAGALRPGGRVFLTTPDIGHRRVPADVTAWDMFSPPRHVQFFDVQTIRILFARYGFEILRRYPNRKPGLQVLARRSA